MASSQFSATSFKNFRWMTSGYSNWRTGYPAVDTTALDYVRHPFKSYFFFNTAAIAAALANKAVDNISITLTPGYYSAAERMDATVHMWRMDNCTAMPSNTLGNSMADGIATTTGENGYFVERLTAFTLDANAQTTAVIATGDAAQRLADSLLDGNALGMFFRGVDEGTTLYKPDGYMLNGGSAAPEITIEYHDAFTDCTAPSSASLSASVSEGNVNLSFSGAAGGVANDISGLEVQYAESTDNSSWSAWAAYDVFSISSGSGSVSVAPSSTRGKYRKFQVRVRGTAGSGYYSGWKAVSGSVRKNSAPAAPGVTAPVASKTIYNSRPRILATVGSDADGHTQTLAVSGYAASSAGAQAVGKKLVLRKSSAAAAGALSISASSTDALGADSSDTARSFTYAVPAWTDPSLVAGETLIKAAHMTELQAAINNVRAYYGMAAYPFSSIEAGVTGMAGWTGHVAELRTAIDQIVALVNGWDTASGTNDISLPAWITISVNCPAAAVIEQLRAALPLL